MVDNADKTMMTIAEDANETMADTSNVAPRTSKRVPINRNVLGL